MAGLAACLVIAVPPGPAQATPSAATPAEPIVEPVPSCFVSPPADLDVQPVHDCGYVVVPQDRANPGGKKVKLGFLRLHARGERREPPLFMLAGGPGSSLIRPEIFQFFSPVFLGQILATRDVVVLDQRGTRHTDPVLDCPALDRLGWTVYESRATEAQALELQAKTLSECIAKVRAQGVDLAQFNSVSIAADVDAARRALGYRRIVYYGASYGAQLGQHVMRDFPGTLESVVLDGANALSRRSWIEDRALDVDHSLRHLAALCRSDPKCRAAYDLPALVDQGLALFDEGPIAATFSDPAEPDRTWPLEVTRVQFVGLVYEKLGDKIGAATLPAILHMLVKDGRKSMGENLAAITGAKLLQQRDGAGGGMSMLMHLAVVCSDDPVRSPDELVLDGVGRLAEEFGRSVTREYVALCRAIDVPSLPDSTDVNVTVDVPTLVLSGGLDAQTPTFRSEVVAKALPDARLVVFPDGTHVQLGSVNLCAGKIMTSFVEDPKRPLPLECLAETRFLGFVLPDGTVSGDPSPAD